MRCLWIAFPIVLGFLAAAIPVSAQPEWTYIGLGNRTVRAIKAQDQYLFAGTDAGVYRKIRTDPGLSWTCLGPDSLAVESLIFLDATTILAGGLDPSGNNLYRSVDQGQTWSAVPTPSPFWTVRDLEQHPMFPDTVYAGSRWVLRSTDSGQTWTQSTPDFIHRWNDVTISPVTPGLVFGGGEDFFFTPSMYRTTDGGETWAVAVTPEPSAENAVNSMIIDPANPNLMYAGMEGFIETSSDGGASWSQVLMALDFYFQDIEIDPRSSARVFMTGFVVPLASAELRIYMSENYGNTWQVFVHAPGGDQLPYDLELVEESGALDIFLGATGVYRVRMLSSTAVTQLEPDRSGTKLHAPLVFAGGIEIRYTVGPLDAPVTVSIFDLQGRRVRELYPDHHGAGEYRSMWRYQNNAGERVPRGVYFVRLQTDLAVLSQKLVVLPIPF